MVEKSCGTIPHTLIDGNIYYLLVKAKDDGYCGFPKGHVEKGEGEIQTAYRELTFESSRKMLKTANAFLTSTAIPSLLLWEKGDHGVVDEE